MSAIRPFAESDLSAVGGLHRRLYPGNPFPEEELQSYFRRIFFENPWYDPEFPSLVSEDWAGRAKSRRVSRTTSTASFGRSPAKSCGSSTRACSQSRPPPRDPASSPAPQTFVPSFTALRHGSCFPVMRRLA